jgi:hypothetical protein
MKTYILSVITSLILVMIIIITIPQNGISNLKNRASSIEQNVLTLYNMVKADASSANETLQQFNTSLGLYQTQLSSSLQTQNENQTASLTNLETKLNNNIATVQSSIQSETTQRSADFNNLNSQISTITNSIATLTSQISSLETSISNLTTEDEDDSDGDIDTEFTSYDLEIEDGDSSFTGTMVLKITNNTDDDVENVIVWIIVEADDDIPDVSTSTLSGGGYTWKYYGQDVNLIYYYNTTGIDIDEDDYEKMTLTLHVYFDDEVDDDFEFEPSVSVSSYDD